METLLEITHRLHVTPLGRERIIRNLKLGTDDVIEYCKGAILSAGVEVERRGKNWYVTTHDAVITINAHSFTIITAHLRGDVARSGQK